MLSPGQLLKVPHNTNTETVSEKNRKTVGVVCRQFDRVSQHQWRLSETTKHGPALEPVDRALWLKVILRWSLQSELVVVVVAVNSLIYDS